MKYLFVALSLASIAALSAQAGPTAIDAQQNLVVDGKPMLPLGVFDVYPKEELAKAAALGYNFVEVPFEQADRAYLDEAQRVGLKVLPWFGGYSDAYLAAALEYINRFKTHPAILGWFTIDEPANFGVSKQVLDTLYREFKKADPDHVVYNNFNTLPNDAEFKDTVDIFSIDPYPIVSPGKPGGNVSSVATETKLAIDSIADSRPVWACPQAFGGVPGWERAPDGEEFRLLMHLPFIHGAKGVCAYTYRGGEFTGIINSPDLQQSSRATNAELTKLAPALLNGKRRTLVKAAVHAGLFDLDGATYAVVANASHLPVTPELPLDPAARVEDAFASEKIAVENGRLKLALAPYGVKAVRVAPALGEATLEGDCGKVEKNLALTGKISTSSSLIDQQTGIPAYVYYMDKANDGRANTQWASADSYVLPVWIQLNLSEPQTINRIVVSTPSASFYDNWKEVRIDFSDGSSQTRTLDNSPLAKPIQFEPRKVTWLRISILSTYSKTHYVGCAELEVYNDEPTSPTAAKAENP